MYDLQFYVQICVKTSLAEYVAARPASTFKKMFSHLMEQTDISFEVRPACCEANLMQVFVSADGMPGGRMYCCMDTLKTHAFRMYPFQNCRSSALWSPPSAETLPRHWTKSLHALREPR